MTTATGRHDGDTQLSQQSPSRERGPHPRWWAVADRRARRPAEPFNPQLLLHERSPRLPDDALLAVLLGALEREASPVAARARQLVLADLADQEA